MNRPFAAPIGFSLLGLVSIVAYLFVSPSESSELLAASSPVLAAIAVVVACPRLIRPVRPVPWLLYAIGIGVLGCGADRASDRVVRRHRSRRSLPDSKPSRRWRTRRCSLRRSASRPDDDMHVTCWPVPNRSSTPSPSTALVWLGVTGPYVDESTMRADTGRMDLDVPLLDGVLATLALRRTDRRDPARSVFQMMALGFLAARCGSRGDGLGGLRAVNSSWVRRSPPRLMVGPLLLGLVVDAAVAAIAGGGDRRTVPGALVADLRVAVRSARPARCADAHARHRVVVDVVVRGGLVWPP